MDGTQGMIVAAMNGSLRTRQTAILTLEPDALAPCATPTETSSSQKMLVLMSLLHGLLKNTTNGDVVFLSTFHGRRLCERLGIDQEIIDETIIQYLQFSDKVRSTNPMAF